MPITPYAKLRVSVNGGAPTTGGVVAPASATAQFSFESTVGWTKYRLALIGPPAWTLPAGWTNEAGTYVYTGVDTPPPALTLPSASVWGKFMPTLTVNDGLRFGAFDAAMIDTATAISILSANALEDVGAFEDTQFSTKRAWAGALQKNLRTVDAYMSLGTPGSPPASALKDPARAATTANITLSGTQTVDGVALVAGDRALVKDQTTGSQNGLYVVSTGAWSRSSDANTSALVPSMMIVGVSEGATNADKLFQLTTNAPITLGTTSLTFASVGGNATATVYGLKDAVRAATTGAITLSGAQTIDGVACIAGDRVLVKDQASASANGIYIVAAGAWARATDAASSVQMPTMTLVPVSEGSTNAGRLYELTTAAPITLGTTALAFATPSITGTINCDVTLDFTASTFTFKASGGGAGDVLQTLPCGISGPVIPATIASNSGLRAKPTGTAASVCTAFGMVSGTGIVSSILPTGSFVHNYLEWAWSQFNLDMSKAFDLYCLWGTRTITQNGSANILRYWDTSKNAYLSCATDELDTTNFGASAVADVAGKIGTNYATPTLSNTKRTTAALSDDLWVARYSPLRIQFFSKAVSGVMPTTDTLKGFTARGIADLSSVNGLSPLLFPGDGDYLEWDLTAQIATAQSATLKKMRVVQRG